MIMRTSVCRAFLRFAPHLKSKVPNQNNKYFNFKQTNDIGKVKSCGTALTVTRSYHLNQVCLKYRKSSNAEESDSDDENTVPEFKDERDSKVIKTKVNSLRADLILKAGLGIARNKIEAIFYDSKIRINGKKLGKKSVQLQVGDEVDVIKGFSQNNTSFIIVSRVIILSADEKEEGFGVNLRRYKTLLIENYAGANAFKSSAPIEHS